jgi:hypothetical protein
MIQLGAWPKRGTGLQHRLLGDAAIALLFFTAGTFLGTYHIAHTSGPQSFYQEYFVAGVAAGCGMGFVNLDQGRVPSLDAFVRLQRDSVPCAEVRQAPTSPANAWQLMHRYQMGMAGLVWRLRGEVSWSGLAPMFGILFGATAAVSYLIARLMLRRALAVVVGLLLLFSPIHLGILPLLRDYSKAPFFLATILFIGIFVLQPLTVRARLLLAALAGLVAGLGFGFRTDGLVCVPPMLVTLLFLVPGRLRDSWLARIASAIVFMALFILLALPPLLAMQAQGANAHVTLLGFSSPFDDALGVDTPDYEWAYLYNDAHIQGLLNAYSHWTTGNTRVLNTNTPPYEQAGNRYLRQIATHVPADMLTRAYGAMLRVLELPANGLSNHLYVDPNQQPIGIADPRHLERFLQVQRLLQLVTSGGAGLVLCTILSLLFVAARDVRLAICLAFTILYFSSYTVLQFSVRHAFHLELVSWIACAFVLQSLWRVLVAWRRRDSAFLDSLHWKPALAFALVLLLVPPAVLLAARVYQERHLRALFTKYIAAPKEPVDYTVVDGTSTDRVLLRFALDPPPAGRMRGDYFLVEVRGVPARPLILFCPGDVLSPLWNHTRTLLPERPSHLYDWYPSDVTRFFFPAWEEPGALFHGIEIQRGAEDAVAVYRIKPSSELPLLLWLTLYPNWRERPLHQRLLGAELRDTFQRSPEARVARGSETAAEVTTLSGVATRGSAGRIRVHARIDASNGTFVQYAPRKVKAGTTFFAEGTIQYGCLSLILDGAGLYLAVDTAQPGPFRFEVTAPQDAIYAPMLANTACPGTNDLTIQRAGWIEP